MQTMKALMQIVICGVVLLVGAGGIFAQEPPPPPPLAADGGKVFFFASIEERSSNKVVTGAPYSAKATTETTQTLADGNQIHHKTTATLYRDGQGRTRREETLGDLGPWSTSQTTPRQIILINDPAAGVHYVLHPDEHVAHKMTPAQVKPGMNTLRKNGAAGGALPPPGEGPDVMFMTGPPPDGAAGMTFAGGAETIVTNKEFLLQDGKGEPGTTESLGTQTMEGVQATGTRTAYTIPAGKIGNELPIQIVTERWYSPELQAVVMSKRSDPRVGVTTYRLANVNQAEPSPDLFQVPADYTVKEGPGFFKFQEPVKPSGNP
jgi:hypothetical protein